MLRITAMYDKHVNIVILYRTKDIAVELRLTDKEVQEMEEMSENQRKVLSPNTFLYKCKFC